MIIIGPVYFISSVPHIFSKNIIAVTCIHYAGDRFYIINKTLNIMWAFYCYIISFFNYQNLVFIKTKFFIADIIKLIVDYYSSNEKKN